jgi:eukaryotic-like serine/threonine-protein kinase
MTGRQLAHFRLIEQIGMGGMGVVYRAHDERLDRSVAIKVLPPDNFSDPASSSRLLREARTASHLNHPNICTIYEVGEADGQAFIAMELVEGQPLSALLASGVLPGGEVLRYGLQMADALAHAHQRGVVHRDFKSANVVVTPDGRAKVLDFGLARRMPPRDPAADSTVTQDTLTTPGQIAGTLAYMAPEQLHGLPADERSDIWALGVVLYEMAAGVRPFKGDTAFDLSSAILHEPFPPLSGRLPGSVGTVVEQCLAKDPAKRYQQAEELRAALACLDRWATEEALPEIERLIGENDVWRDLVPAYRLAEQAEKYIPGNPRLAELFSRCSLRINVATEPAGATIAMKEYGAPEGEWSSLGVSPLENVRVPVGVFRWRIEKEGYDTVLAVSSTWDIDPESRHVVVPYHLTRVLEKTGAAPPGMVRVENTAVGDFYIDRHEVTNRQYKAFVDAGGYCDTRYWKHAFVESGRELTWEEAAGRFVDQTGRAGPATWQGGDYPDGQGDYPVSGVSWYEAAAYVEYAGRVLPTGSHWDQARGAGTPLIQWPQLGGNAVFLRFSNFGGRGPVPVGTLQGITAFGAADMAGNVREWCFNETSRGRLIRGGGWEDNAYMFGDPAQAPPMDRSPKNGFRSALYVSPADIPASAFQPIAFGERRDFYKEVPVSEPVFEAYREQFAYDRTDLRSRVEQRYDNPAGWIRERVTFDAAYGGERVIMTLFLPAHVPPPYQTVIYVPGSASLAQSSSGELEGYYEFPMFLSFVVKSGRAVAYPVYKGTFERGNPALLPMHLGEETYQYTEFLVQVVKDFRRSVDYLESRSDIDSRKLAYYGMSWGGLLGAIVPAVEPRLGASVLAGAGLTGRGRPEASQINYITRVRTPTLMLGGKYDAFFGGRIRPMFDLLGTAGADKQLKLYETDHVPPRNELIKETLDWLDRYLGPVR